MTHQAAFTPTTRSAWKLSRRGFIVVGFSGAGAQLLQACGGGGNDTPATGTSTIDPSLAVQYTAQPLTGSVSLPSGASITGLSIQSTATAATPVVDGQFAFSGFVEGPILVCAFDTAGNLVLAGLLDATHLQLSAASTALVLANYALGVAIHPQIIQDSYAALLTATGALDGLTAAISAAIVLNGSAWATLPDAGVAAAMAQVFVTFGPTDLQADAGSPGAAIAAGRGRALGVIVDPTERTSGLLANADGISKVVFQNYYRRRAYLYAERISYTPKGGAAVASPALIQPQPIKVPPVKSLPSILVLGGQLAAGVRDYYDPVSISPIAIPLAPADAAVTRYQVTAVGLGSLAGGFDPDSLTADQLSGFYQVSIEQIVFEMVLPLVINFVLPHNKAALKSLTGFAETSTVLRDLTDALLATDTIGPKIRAGKVGDAIQDVFVRIANTSSLRTILINLVKSWSDVSWTLVGESGLSLPALQSSFVDKSSKALTGAMAIFNAAKQGFDTIVIMNDLDFSHSADRFTFDTTPSVVKLNPLSSQADAIQAPIALTASVIDAQVLPNSVLSYRWTCACLFGNISDHLHTNQQNGTTFNGATNVLAYNPTGHALGGDIETVTVQIFLGPIPDPIDNRQPLGQASSTITYNAVVLPASPNLEAGASQTFTLGPLSSKLPNGLQFVWTMTGRLGTVGGSTTTTTSTPSVVFQAGLLSGIDTLTVQILDANNTVLTSGATQVSVLNATFTLTPASLTAYGPHEVMRFQVTSTAGMPADTRYLWTATKGAMAEINTNWTSGGPNQLTTTSLANYNVPAAYPNNGQPLTDIVTVEALNTAGTVLATAQATVTYGTAPYIELLYYYVPGGKNIDSVIAGVPDSSRAGHCTSPLCGVATTDAFIVNIPSGSGGPVAQLVLTVPIGGFPSGSFTVIDPPSISHPSPAAGTVWINGSANSSLGTYPVTGGSLTITSTMGAPGGGQYVGFSIDWDTSTAGSKVMGNGMVIMHA